MKKTMEKFKIRSGTIGLVLTILIITMVAYFVCTYYLNLNNLNIVNETSKEKIVKLQTLRDILLVIISICGTNLLLSIIVEKKSKNSLVEDIILNDVVASPEFYKQMDNNKKKKMFYALEEELFFKHNITHEMFKIVREKIINMSCDYYYESCKYIVTCNVHDNYIEKEITRKVSLKSYEKEYIIKNFSIGNCSSKKIEGMESYQLISFEINNQKIDLKKFVKEIENKDRCNLDEQNEYDSNKKFIYNKPLKITNDKETTIVVKCKTRTAIDDKSSTFRVVKPCKNFSVVYSIIQHEKYRLVVDAFGFLDNADDSANNTSSSNININFDDWIFKYDGVVVIILEK